MSARMTFVSLRQIPKFAQASTPTPPLRIKVTTRIRRIHTDQLPNELDVPCKASGETACLVFVDCGLVLAQRDLKATLKGNRSKLTSRNANLLSLEFTRASAKFFQVSGRIGTFSQSSSRSDGRPLR